jgi:hypothetical protein
MADQAGIRFCEQRHVLTVHKKRGENGGGGRRVVLAHGLEGKEGDRGVQLTTERIG